MKHTRKYNNLMEYLGRLVKDVSGGERLLGLPGNLKLGSSAGGGLQGFQSIPAPNWDDMLANEVCAALRALYLVLVHIFYFLSRL